MKIRIFVPCDEIRKIIGEHVKKMLIKDEVQIQIQKINLYSYSPIEVEYEINEEVEVSNESR